MSNRISSNNILGAFCCPVTSSLAKLFTGIIVIDVSTFFTDIIVIDVSTFFRPVVQHLYQVIDVFHVNRWIF